jgi:hypothetical protein
MNNINLLIIFFCQKAYTNIEEYWIYGLGNLFLMKRESGIFGEEDGRRKSDSG